MTIAPELFELFDDFDAQLAPEYRAELVAGEIIVNPPANGNHEIVVARIARKLDRESAVETDALGGRGIHTPFGKFIPDLTVGERDAMNDELDWGTPEGVLMVVEVTSTRSGVDRLDRRRAYAAAGIPLYLLVDRQNKESVLFSDPDVEALDYETELRIPFGSPLPLPAPFSFTLTDFTPLPNQ